MTTPVASASATTPAPASGGEKALRQAAQQFEAVFLRQMIGAMRQASAGEGLFDSAATEQFRDMSDARLADQMAGQGALHVADLLVKQLGARIGSAGK